MTRYLDGFHAILQGKASDYVPEYEGKLRIHDISVTNILRDYPSKGCSIMPRQMAQWRSRAEVI